MIPWLAVFFFGGICAYTDVRELIIRDKVTLPALVTGIVYQASWGNGWKFAVTGIALGLVIGLLNVFFNGGFGDGKLMMAMGAWLGWFSLLCIFLFAALIALSWYACRVVKALAKGGKASQIIPFGVCLYSSTLLLGVLVWWPS